MTNIEPVSPANGWQGGQDQAAASTAGPGSEAPAGDCRLKSAEETAGLLAQTNSECRAETQRYADLQASRDSVIVDGDDAAVDDLDGDIKASLLQVRRLVLRAEALDAELQAAIDREATAAREDRRAEVQAMVDDALAELEMVYEPAAVMIAEFLDRWRAATDAATAFNSDGSGRVLTPDQAARVVPDETTPPRPYEHQIWKVPSRHHAGRMVPVTNFRIDPVTGEQVPAEAGAQLVTETHTMPAVTRGGKVLPPLHKAVALPEGRAVLSPIWPPNGRQPNGAG